jgi:ribosomal RNA assembly protein
MTENSLCLRIPLNRIGVLIGVSGKVKATIKEKYDVNIEVDSDTGNVWISPVSDTTDLLAMFRVRDIILAIGRGFSPEKAFKLFREEVNFGIIDLRDYFGKAESDIKRVKSRIIGKKGKARRLIEELSGADICVRGPTVAIIGGQLQFRTATEAIERLIRGDQHKNVYDFLQRKRREFKIKDSELWKNPNQF